MIRQAEREQDNRLMVKTPNQVFIARAREGLGCSLFEAQPLTELVKEVYFPRLSQPEAIQAGQLAMTAVSADEPGNTEWDSWPRLVPFPAPLTRRALGQTFVTEAALRMCRSAEELWQPVHEAVTPCAERTQRTEQRRRRPLCALCALRLEL
jgi:hypothetical protein